MTQKLMPAVLVIGLHVERGKQFGLVISRLHLSGGTVLCITGPNGSGKTTFIECLTGLLQPDSGSISIAGRPIRGNLQANRSMIGYIPDDEAWFIPELCADEYFSLLQHIYSEAGVKTDMLRKVAELSKVLRFTDSRTQIGMLSHGNKKKVQLIAGLMHQPPVIIIDELRNGLDPLAIKAAEELVRQEANRGACVIAATHDLWWAERVADQTLILIEGKSVIHEATKKITQEYGHLEAAFLRKVEAAT